MTSSRLYVPDASVILKWIFDSPKEADREAALALLEDWTKGQCDLLLPSLWIYEVGNIVGRNIPEKAFDFLEMLIEYRIEESPVTAKIAGRTLAIMDQCGVTFYDAVYHAVALERRGTLLTADASYLKKAGKLGSVLLLADLY